MIGRVVLLFLVITVGSFFAGGLGVPVQGLASGSWVQVPHTYVIPDREHPFAEDAWMDASKTAFRQNPLCRDVRPACQTFGGPENFLYAKYSTTSSDPRLFLYIDAVFVTSSVLNNTFQKKRTVTFDFDTRNDGFAYGTGGNRTDDDLIIGFDVDYRNAAPKGSAWAVVGTHYASQSALDSFGDLILWGWDQSENLNQSHMKWYAEFPLEIFTRFHDSIDWLRIPFNIRIITGFPNSGIAGCKPQCVIANLQDNSAYPYLVDGLLFLPQVVTTTTTETQTHQTNVTVTHTTTVVSGTANTDMLLVFASIIVASLIACVYALRKSRRRKKT